MLPGYHRLPRAARHHLRRRRRYRRSLLHAAHRGRRGARHRGCPRAAAGGRRQGLDQHRRRSQPGVRGRGGGEVRHSVHCRRHRCQAGRGRLRDLHPRRAQADGDRRHCLGSAHGGRRGRRNSADLHGPRRHARRLRYRTDTDAVTVPVIASGGVGTLDHLVEGIRDGHATAVLAASIFHFGEHSIGEAKAHMRAAGIPVRP